MKTVRPSVALLLLMFLQGFVPFAHGQAGGSIRGTVTLAGDGSPIHGVPVRILELGLSVLTAADGSYAFAEVPPGTYQIMASLDGFNDMINTVTVAPGSAAISDFQLRLIGHRDEITVTASGREEVAYQSFKVTTSLDSVDLAKNARASIGEALEQQPGIAKRSYGPGPSRPVIRGFDGDRVLILQDGARTGSLSSQSGDHAEPINALSLDRLEVVKGPSTLLYGSNALGGVVNAITGHDHAHPGLRGALTAVGGSNNGQGSANGSFEFGAGRLLIWGSGGGQRTGNYRTARGEIFNSETRLADASVGAGWFGERGYFSAGYDFGDARYGIPTGTEPESQIPEDEELVDLSMRRHSVPLRFGWTNLGSAWDALRVALTYNQYHHKELNREEVETTFDNKQFTYRATLEQPQGGRYSGTVGLEGWHRDYQTVGAEA
ncbi:MAG TPA: TonB-dependent receptor plug domain-containing protein, partial [Terriglobia bacterium]|nr:TonB-dependent receptor plug domain-containing protein [Terriglobia bacterium]